MKIPKCQDCNAMAACRYMQVSGVDAQGQAYGGHELFWFCAMKGCKKFKQTIEPEWVEVPEA